MAAWLGVLLLLFAIASGVRGCILDRADAAGPRTFKGYQCTQDCSGHRAGYEWAQKKGIDDPRRCGGNSRSFIEGCTAYANGK